MTDNLSLRASREKIERAKRKFDNLVTAVNDFIRSEPHSVRTEVKRERVYIIARIEKDVPLDIGFEAVEIVGHLRSALDKMIVAFVRKNGRGVSGVGFPFGGLDENGKPRAFPDARVESGIKKKLTPDQWSFVMAHKPHPGGNPFLWSLNEIANADKHREDLVEVVPNLAPSFSVGAHLGLLQMTNLHIGVGQDNSVLNDKEREQVLASFDAANFNGQVQCKISESVVFGKVIPVQGKNLITTLDQHIRLVGIIVAEGEKLIS